MKYALIDIGSNTIRLVIYENGKEILNNADYAGLISYVSDGRISSDGIIVLVRSIIKMKQCAEKENCKSIYAFATASLRDVEQKDSLIETVYEMCGIKIDIISGEKEAYYDYLGLKSINKAEFGMGFDLGGGSCQIISFNKDGSVMSKSLPIGSLRLYNCFVSGELPDSREQESIYRYVIKSLNIIKDFENFGNEVIFGMGGAVFAIYNLAKKYIKDFDGTINKSVLTEICKLSEKKIMAVSEKRVRTVIPAAITMIAILDFFRCTSITATPAGVRNGVLAEKYGIQ